MYRYRHYCSTLIAPTRKSISHYEKLPYLPRHTVGAKYWWALLYSSSSEIYGCVYR